MFRMSSGVLACVMLALAMPSSALAVALVLNKQGDVQSAVAGGHPAPVAERQRLKEGSTVSTASGGRAILRFNDGLQIALEEGTTVRIVEYRYRDAMGAASEDRIAVELQRGAVRVVTGMMAERSPGAFSLRAPQADLTLRGPTDFIVALVNPMYLSVLQGTVVTANAAGRLALAEGARVSIAGANAVPVTISAAALPTPAATAMQNLQLANVTTPGAAASGALPTGGAAATGGVGLGAGVVFMGAAIAGAAGALNSDGEDAAATTHH